MKLNKQQQKCIRKSEIEWQRKRERKKKPQIDLFYN